MGNFGWDRVVNGVNFPPQVREKFTFFRDPESRNQKIHITMIGESEALCNNSVCESGFEIIDKFNAGTKKNLCRNCGRVMLSVINKEDVHDDIVKRAKRTVTRPKKSSKHKRLEAHEKSLRKTKEDFMRAMEKTENSTIKLPDEVGPEKDSLNETLGLTAPILTVLRKSAVMNLDRIMNEWRRLPPNSNGEFTLVQQAQHLKQLIVSIDQIRSFPKQT
jgi:hypothetical protein